MGKDNLLLLMLLGCTFVNVNGQTFNDNYNAFKQKVQSDYEDFREKANQEYADWMKTAWEWHDKIEPMLLPKDEMLPPIKYTRGKEKEEHNPIPYEDITPIPSPQPQPKPIAPIKENDGDFKQIKFLFFGTDGVVRLPKNSSFRINGRNEEAFASAWDILSSNQYNNLIRDCLFLRMKHQLCDWAYLLMLGDMSEAVFGKGTNEATLLQAFVFCQSGYMIRLGLTKEGDLRLLFKSKHQIFDLSGFEMQDGLFYLLHPIDDDGLNVCDVSYPGEMPLSLWILQEQMFEHKNSKERILTPSDNKIGIKVQTNENLISFFESYPTSMVNNDIISRWAMYANTPLSKKVKDKLYPQLKSVICMANNKVIAAEWLLYWVQTAFVYEYDDKVWGHDRAFFAEETLYYPYCDCEDRSILFSRLVRDLLGLDVILVFYPRHLATAVAFNTPIEGDHINIQGKLYTICDPTYIGAPIGVTMPGMDNLSAKIILLNR